MVKNWFFLLLISLFGLAGPVHTYAQLSDPVWSLIERGAVQDAYWSVIVSDSAGNILESYNPEKLVRPASNLKLLTGAAYLEYLGADFTFKTKLYGTGTLVGDVWRGDLIVRGSGDPSISGTFYDGNPLFLFEKWVELFDSLGIKRIDGNIIGNTAYFDNEIYPKGWDWDDLTYYYGVEISALSFNNNAVDLEVLADGAVGSTPSIQWFPFNTPYVNFINEQLITPRGTRYRENYRRELGTNTIYLRSTLPAGYYETEPLSVPNAPLYFVDTMKRYLEIRGISVGGQILTDHQPYDWDDSQFKLLDTHESVPLSQLMVQMQKESDNFYAEMLLKTLGAQKFNTQGTTELGIQAVKEFMHGFGLDSTKVNMRDGSGLSSATIISASNLNRLLVNMQHHPHFDVFYNSLAVSGTDGTLGHRMRGSALQGRFNGKTGFITGIRALSGYLNTSGGQRLIVTITTNNYTVQTSVVDRIHERILQYYYSNY